MVVFKESKKGENNYSAISDDAWHATLVLRLFLLWKSCIGGSAVELSHARLLDCVNRCHRLG
jgi:hypothetical protein